MEPILYGFKQTNHLISNFIRIFLNAYSDKLFKIDDQIIDRNESNDFHNIFYLCPIHIKESVLHFGLNTFKIQRGDINNIIIYVPIFGTNQNTKFSIDSIMIDACLEQINSVGSTMLKSDFPSDINENNLTDILKKTKEIIMQYFSIISCTINSITINLGYFMITLSDIIIDDQVYSVKRIQITNLFIISNLIYNASSNLLTIDQLHINIDHFDKLPEFYIEYDTNKKFILQCTINLCIIDKIQLNGINISFGNEIICHRINYIDINDHARLSEISPFTFRDNVLIFQSNNFIRIYDRYRLIAYARYMYDHIGVLFNKIISVGLCDIPDENTTSSTTIQNISLTIDQLNLLVQVHIGLYKNDGLHDVTVKNDSTCMTIKQLIVKDLITFFDVHLLSDSFNGVSKKIMYNNNQISFQEGQIEGISNLINYITEIIGKIFTEKSDDKSKKIFLDFYDIDVIHKENNMNFHALVKKMKIHITDNEIIDFDVLLFYDAYLIGHINKGYLNDQKMIIDSVKIYLDPDIFDKLNHLFGILIKKDQQEMMTTAVIAESMLDLESIIQSKSVHLAKLFQMSMSSIHQLHSVIMDNYKPNVMEKLFNLKIMSVGVYLFDELVEYSYLSQIKKPPFLSIALKGIDFKKYIDQTSEKYGFKIASCSIADLRTNFPKQKYLLKNTYQDGSSFLCIIMTMNNAEQHARITLSPLTFHINEETLCHILNFFSQCHQLSDETPNTEFSKLQIDQIDLIINYYPIILDHNLISLQNCKLSLKSQKIQQISGFQNIYQYLIDKWKSDLNIFQFIPSINIIQPLLSPFTQIYYFIQKYFSNPANKKIILNLIKQVSISPMMIKNGFNKITDFLV